MTDIETVRKSTHVTKVKIETCTTQIMCAIEDITYELTIQKINNTHNRLPNELTGGHFVSIDTFEDLRMRTMYVRPREYLTWCMIRNRLGIQDKESAYVVTLILACVIDTQYSTRLEFEQSLEMLSKQCKTKKLD